MTRPTAIESLQCIVDFLEPDYLETQENNWIMSHAQNALSLLKDGEPKVASLQDDDSTIRERDDYHDWADRLADAIAEFTGVDIGEHSSANNPWQNALDALGEADSVPAGESVQNTYTDAVDNVAYLLTGNDGEDDGLTVLQQLAANLGDRTVYDLIEKEQAASVPDGWKLVPVEPTDEMKKAAWEYFCKTTTTVLQFPDAAHVYRAMLNAAPEPKA